MHINGYVGCQRESKVIKYFLADPPTKESRIQSIKGPSGIGKSTGLAKAFRVFAVDNIGYLKIELFGANRGVDGSSGRSELASVSPPSV